MEFNHYRRSRLVCLLALAGLLTARTALLAGQLRSISLSSGGLLRTALLYVPDNLPAKACPLVLMLHGAGGSGTNAMSSETEYRWNQLADTSQFLVAYPDGVSNRWHDCRADASNQLPTDDVGFLSALIDHIDTLHTVDTRRVYAAGHSNGAMMCLRLAMELSDRIAAVCVNSGSLAAVSDCARLSRPVSLIYCMGTADPIIPFTGGEINLSAPASGTVLPASATLTFWTSSLSIPPIPERTNTYPDLVGTDRSTVTEYDYQRAQNGAELVYLQVNGGGHGWPAPTQFSLARILLSGRKNQDIFLCDLAWNFFQRHTLGGPPLRISSLRSPGNLQLRWDWGILQTSTNLADWKDLPTISPTNLPLTRPKSFYRLRSP